MTSADAMSGYLVGDRSPEDGADLPSVPATMSPRSGIRGDRPAFIGFVRDTETAHVIRTAFAPAFPTGLALHQCSFDEAIAMLELINSPETILVDISGADQPLNAIHRLEAVVDPGTRVLAIGDQRSVSFYRSMTRNLGVREYLCKPLDPALVAQELLPWATGQEPDVEPARGGTMIALCGAAGGVGTTFIAANLAWFIGVETLRHTLLLDADLHGGSAALATNVPPSTGLRNALESPDRIDPLLIERAAHPLAGRLHVLAAEEPLHEPRQYRPGGGRTLAAALRQRYNFVIADIPARPLGFAAEILNLAHQRILITDDAPQSLANVRRWLDLPSGPMQAARPLVVLNRQRHHRHQSVSRIAEIIGIEPIVIVPDVGAAGRRATDLGEMLAGRKGNIRNAIARLAQIVGGAVPPGH